MIDFSNLYFYNSQPLAPSVYQRLIIPSIILLLRAGHLEKGKYRYHILQGLKLYSYFWASFIFFQKISRNRFFHSMLISSSRGVISQRLFLFMVAMSSCVNIKFSASVLPLYFSRWASSSAMFCCFSLSNRKSVIVSYILVAVCFFQKSQLRGVIFRLGLRFMQFLKIVYPLVWIDFLSLSLAGLWSYFFFQGITHPQKLYPNSSAIYLFVISTSQKLWKGIAL